MGSVRPTRTMLTHRVVRKLEASRMRRRMFWEYVSEAALYIGLPALVAGSVGWLVWAILTYAAHNASVLR